MQKAEKPAPVLTVRSLSVNRGSTVRISQNTLKIEDAIPPNYLVITINSLPDEGKLLISSGKNITNLKYSEFKFFFFITFKKLITKFIFLISLFSTFLINQACLAIVS